MDSRKMCISTLEEQERLRLKRKEWRIQQEYDKKHEERKLKMIAEYERKRAQDIKKQMSMYERQSKSSSPQRKEDSFPDYGHSKERKSSEIVNDPQNVIDEKILHKIKITIYNEKNLPTKNQSTSNKIEWNFVNFDDVILPRRSNEGIHPIFQRDGLEKTKEIRTITISQNEQLEKQLSTSKMNEHTHRRSDDDITQRYCLHKSKIYRRERTDDDDANDGNTYNHNRERNSSRDNKEKDKSRSGRRSRSTSRHNNRTAPLIKDRLRSRYRSSSHSPVSEKIKQKRIDNNKNKFSSRRNLGQTCKLDNRVSSKPLMNYSFSDNFDTPYISLFRPMLMPRMQIPPMPMARIQTQHMLMPIFSPLFPGTLPNIHQWQRSPANSSHRWQRNRNQY